MRVSDCHSRVVFLLLSISLRSPATALALFALSALSVDLALSAAVYYDCDSSSSAEFTLSSPALVTSYVSLSPSLAHSRVADCVSFFFLDFLVNF